jgi:hypothetical protein
VSSELNQLCIPFLYRDLDLDQLNRHTYYDFHGIITDTLPKYGQHVKSIRIHLGKELRNYIIDEWQFVIRAIARVVHDCPSATSIALYYTSGGTMMDELASEIVRKIERGSVIQLGLYSTTIMESDRSQHIWDTLSTKGPADLLRRLLGSRDACHNLRRLDLVMENLTADLFDLIRSEISNLHSLTIRRTLRQRLPGIGQGGKWAINNNLTRLQLMGCVSAHAADMPRLVRHFTGLRELVWATCGHHDDIKPPPPLPGWNRHPESLPSVRAPLRLLHLEHVVEWEIIAMSIIPAETVMVTNHDELLLTHSFCRGIEMFLGMKTLRVLPPHSEELVRTTLPDLRADRQAFRGASLGSICEERGVTLLRDAEILFPCSCCVYRPEPTTAEV